MWSQIQRKLYEIIDPKINLQVHCASIRAAAKRVPTAYRAFG